MKGSRYTREIQSIITAGGMHENEILNHLHESGYADMTKETLYKVLKEREDLFKRDSLSDLYIRLNLNLAGE